MREQRPIMRRMVDKPRRGPGRPRLDPTGRRVALTISLPPKQVEYLKAWAFARDVTISKAIQQLILREMAASMKAEIRSVSLPEVLYRLRQSKANRRSPTPGSPRPSPAGRRSEDPGAGRRFPCSRRTAE